MTDVSRGLLFVDAEVNHRRVDVRVGSGKIVEIAPNLTRNGERVIRCDGGAVLPGLHDHHLHLNALAAARRSTLVGPPQVRSLDQLRAALRGTSPVHGWIRAIGYDDSVAGALDRRILDELDPDRAVRVQHRSGALWVLNSRALERVERFLDESGDVERDGDGRPNGRLWRYDQRLQRALPDEDFAQRSALRLAVRELLSLGITSATDATPDLDAKGVDLLGAASPVRLLLLGAPDRMPLPDNMSHGPRKLLLRDHELPSFEALCGAMDPAAEGRGRRPAAVHCVTRESLLLTIAALDEIGTVPGDRIEHAAIVPAGTEVDLARLGVTVVTQPDFLRTRGDDYLRDVDPADRENLYRWAGVADAGVTVVGSSDAPFGQLDPWQVIRSANERTTSAGLVIGTAESVTTAEGLRGYLTRPEDPGGKARQVTEGSPGDLCVLAVPLSTALAAPSCDFVSMTVVGGIPADELPDQ